MIKTLFLKQNKFSFILKDGFFDSKDPSFNTKISTYLDLIQIYGFRASQLSMDIKLVDKGSGKTYLADLLVYDKFLKPQIIIKVKSAKEYDEYISQKFITDLFELANFSVNSIKYLVLVYPNVTGYIDQKDLVVIDFDKYQSFKDWEKAGFKHLDFIPVI